MLFDPRLRWRTHDPLSTLYPDQPRSVFDSAHGGQRPDPSTYFVNLCSAEQAICLHLTPNSVALGATVTGEFQDQQCPNGSEDSVDTAAADGSSRDLGTASLDDHGAVGGTIPTAGFALGTHTVVVTDSCGHCLARQPRPSDDSPRSP
ncbi:MAG: hypothetical protein ACR2JC_15505 [Chloroflexota bacterium]|nr:MAG: hypothetical protein DLM70_17300 [Chloroflexota bacterium]